MQINYQLYNNVDIHFQNELPVNMNVAQQMSIKPRYECCTANGGSKSHGPKPSSVQPNNIGGQFYNHKRYGEKNRNNRQVDLPSSHVGPDLKK